MKKSIPVAKLVDRRLPASLVPIGSVFGSFMPSIAVLTLDTLERMFETEDAYADEVVLADPALPKIYSFPTMI